MTPLALEFPHGHAAALPSPRQPTGKLAALTTTSSTTQPMKSFQRLSPAQNSNLTLIVCPAKAERSSEWCVQGSTAGTMRAISCQWLPLSREIFTTRVSQVVSASTSENDQNSRKLALPAGSAIDFRRRRSRKSHTESL